MGLTQALSIMDQMINQERQLSEILVVIFKILIVKNQTIPIMSQTVLLCTISNDCMASYWGPRGTYVMSYQANAILKT
jgi:hypothetical protein